MLRNPATQWGNKLDISNGRGMIVKSKLMGVGTLALSAIIACGMAGCSLQPAEQQGPDRQGAEQQSESSPLSLVGAFHPLTGASEPTEYNKGAATEEQIAVAADNATKNEANRDTKTVFVMVEVRPDDQENLAIGSPERLSSGERVSGAELTVDGINTYNDSYSLNRKGYFSLLSDLGYHGGGISDTLYAGTTEPYRAVFLFWIGNNDFENGGTAHLEWGDFGIDFNMSDVREVGSPLEMVNALQEA